MTVSNLVFSSASDNFNESNMVPLCDITKSVGSIDQDLLQRTFLRLGAFHMSLDLDLESAELL